MAAGFSQKFGLWQVNEQEQLTWRRALQFNLWPSG